MYCSLRSYLNFTVYHCNMSIINYMLSFYMMHIKATIPVNNKYFWYETVPTFIMCVSGRETLFYLTLMPLLLNFSGNK